MALDRGFGSPSNYTGALDWGFGDPTPTAWSPLAGPLSPGFGDPSSAPSVPLPLSGDVRYSDEGGEIVNMSGFWPSRGPYRVRLDDGAQLYPVAGHCYSARPGSGVDCYTEPQLKILSFATPPVPTGTYDIVIYYGPSFGASVRLVSALEIVPRGQAPEVYELCARFPAFWQVGPSSARLQPLDLPTHPTEATPTLTRALGQVLQQVTGSPTTRLTAPLLISDTTATVESPLGFPVDGAEILIGPRRYSYSSISGLTLVGLVLLSASDASPISPRTEVILDARSILPD